MLESKLLFPATVWLILALIARAHSVDAILDYWVGRCNQGTIWIRSALAASYLESLLLLALAVIIEIEARTKWFLTNPLGILVGGSLIIALLSTALWDAIKGFSGRQREVIANAVTKAAGTLSGANVNDVATWVYWIRAGKPEVARNWLLKSKEAVRA